VVVVAACVSQKTRCLQVCARAGREEVAGASGVILEMIVMLVLMMTMLVVVPMPMLVPRLRMMLLVADSVKVQRGRHTLALMWAAEQAHSASAAL
jgi:hypothetical protein